MGIGLFHAITRKTEVEIRDTLLNQLRSEIVEPLANYNIIALDQRFNQNSSVSFVNTHVFRNQYFRNANVSGLYWDLINDSNSYQFTGGAEGSWIYGNDKKFGTELSLGFYKISGKNRFGTYNELRTIDYDINDMGFTGETNYLKNEIYFNHRLLKPKGIFNNYNINVSADYAQRLKTALYSNFQLGLSTFFNTKKFFAFGGDLIIEPFKTNDIYEPRDFNYHLTTPAHYSFSPWISTDYRKTFALDIRTDWDQWFEGGRNSFYVSIEPRVRISDKWKAIWETEIYRAEHEIGFAGRREDDIFMGERNVRTVINGLKSTYLFNPEMTLELTLRHYVSAVDYVDFFRLNLNGDLENTSFAASQNNTFNSWNLDLRYSWWFAPGSNITLLYRNALDDFNINFEQDYGQNISDIWELPKINNLSVRIIYFIDYNRIKDSFNS